MRKRWFYVQRNNPNPLRKSNNLQRTAAPQAYNGQMGSMRDVTKVHSILRPLQYTPLCENVVHIENRTEIRVRE